MKLIFTCLIILGLSAHVFCQDDGPILFFDEGVGSNNHRDGKPNNCQDESKPCYSLEVLKRTNGEVDTFAGLNETQNSVTFLFNGTFTVRISPPFSPFFAFLIIFKEKRDPQR